MAINYLTAWDQQHSVLASAGTARSYPPYGALSAATGPRLAYCGQLREALTGAYCLGNGHRSYIPNLMRFVSPDALSPFAKGGINAYAYCAGDPINYQDRAGRAPGRNYTLPKIGDPGWNLRGNMFRDATGSEGSYQMSSSTQTYNSHSESVVVDPPWVDTAVQAWMYGSAISAVVHTLVGFEQLSYNRRAAASNFVAAGADIVALGVAWMQHSMGVGGSSPMPAGEQLLLGGASGLILGTQITLGGFAAYMSKSTPSTNGRQSGNDLEMQRLNSSDSSSVVPSGNSEAGTLLRESN